MISLGHIPQDHKFKHKKVGIFFFFVGLFVCLFVLFCFVWGFMVERGYCEKIFLMNDLAPGAEQDSGYGNVGRGGAQVMPSVWENAVLAPVLGGGSLSLVGVMPFCRAKNYTMDLNIISPLPQGQIPMNTSICPFTSWCYSCFYSFSPAVVVPALVKNYQYFRRTTTISPLPLLRGRL